MKNNQQKVASTRIFKSKFAQFSSAKNWSKKKKQVKNHPKLHQNRDHLRKHHLSFQIEFAIKFYPPQKNGSHLNDPKHTNNNNNLEPKWPLFLIGSSTLFWRLQLAK